MERSMTESYELVGVPVTGGDLAAGVWNRGGMRTVLAFHGITASHQSWRAVARALPGFAFVAPDLRGRGASRGLVGSFGMTQHAADAAAVLDALSITDPVEVLGHSMGGFAAMRFALTYPRRVRSITLVDGGIPLLLPTGVPIAEVMRASLGPALARLEQTYPSRAAYRDFWRAHPAFVGEWNDDVEAYVDYDLVGSEPNLRSSASGSAALGDAVEQGAGTSADEPWSGIASPISFLSAPRGLLNGPPLYAPDYIEGFATGHPNLTVVHVSDVNHYTIVMNSKGADAIAAAIKQTPSTNQQSAFQ
jgi:lipase